MTPGYEALHRGAAWVDWSARGRIYVTGEDRARLLHALTTNHIQQMKPGDRVYAFFLIAQGRILSDVTVVCEEERFLLDIEPEVRDVLMKHIDHYIIADDVTLEDATDRSFSLEVEGRRIYGDAADKQSHIPAGLVEASQEDARTVRIERFHPRFGEDISPTTLPQETGLTYALHFNKGCYLGQEIVERIHSRGLVHRVLTGLSIEATNPPAPGTVVTFEGAEVGKITSSTFSPMHNEVRAIAMLRTQAAKAGTAVEVEGAKALTSAVS